MAVTVRRVLVSLVTSCLVCGGLIAGAPDAAAAPVTIITPEPVADVTGGETYHPNPTTVETVPEFVMSPALTTDGTESTHCARVERAVITGLKDDSVAESIMSQTRARQDEFLAETWEVDEVRVVDHCLPSTTDGDGQLTLTIEQEASFANLLCLDLGWEDLATRTSGVISAVNARLDTGQMVGLEDLFGRGTDVEDVIRTSAEPGLTDQQIAALVEAYTNDREADFLLNESSVTLRPGVGDSAPVAQDIRIVFADHWNQIAVYDLASDATGLYLWDADPVTCPALTRYEAAADPVGGSETGEDVDNPWATPYCWYADPVDVGTVDVDHRGGEATIRLDLDPSAGWLVASSAEIISEGPTPTQGVGRDDITFSVDGNPGSTPREATIDILVADPHTGQAYTAVVTIRQSGRAAPGAPVVTTANADRVEGSLDKAFSPDTTIVVAWPDQTWTTPMPPNTRGMWEVPTPTGMTSGQITVVATNVVGESEVTAELDTGVPQTPVIVTADRHQVVGVLRGTVDPGTTVLLTWPDRTQSMGVAVREDSAFAVPTPAGMPSGVVMVWATDQAGNLSPAATAQVNADPIGAPRITAANATHVSGEATPDATTMTISWPDGSTQADVLVENGVFDQPTPPTMGSGVVKVWAPGDQASAGSAYLDTAIPASPLIASANRDQIAGSLPATKDHDGAVDVIYATHDRGRVDVQVSVGTAGVWSLPTPKDAIEEEITVTVTDLSGNQSALTSAELDLTAPEPAVVDLANASQISGVAPESGSVTVRYPTITGPEATVTADVDARGSWSVATPVDARDGDIQATMADPAGNRAEPTLAALDVTPGGEPLFEQVNADGISGRVEPTGEADMTVRLTGPDGATICTTAVAEDGTWTCLVPDSMTTDTQILAVSVDGAQNLSRATATVMDLTPPNQPVISTASTLGVSGLADPGSILRLTWPDGTAILVAAGSSDGAWSVVPPASATSGGRIGAQALDQAGNTSPTATATLSPAASDPDPISSSLALSADSLRVVVPACGGEVELAPTGLTAQVDVRDDQGAALPGVVVDFSAMGGLTPATNTVVTNESGVATVEILIDPNTLVAGGEPSVHAAVMVAGAPREVSGSPAALSATVIQASAEPVPPLLTIVSRATVVPANGFATYNVLLEWIDGCGRAGVGAEVEFTSDGSASLSQDSATLDAYGQAWLQVTDSVAETVQVGAVVDGEEIEPVELVFAPARPDPAQSTLRAGESLVPIPCEGPGATALTATVKDEDGHPLHGVPVRFDVIGDATLSEQTTSTNESGQAKVRLTSEVEGSAHVTATLTDGTDGAKIALTGAGVDLTFAADCHLPQADSSSVWFAVSDGPKMADGTDSYTVTIFAKDANGGDVGGLDESLEIIADDALQVGDLDEHHPGEYVATLVSSSPGAFPIRATITLPDGTVRELTGHQTTATFIPSWLAYMTTSADQSLSPATGETARASDGRDASVITVHLSARLDGAPQTALVGQAGLLGFTDDVPDEVDVSAFTEVEPGVYVASVTSQVPGRYDLVTTWNQSGTTLIEGRTLTVDFVDHPTDSLHPPTSVATSGSVSTTPIVVPVLIAGIAAGFGCIVLAGSCLGGGRRTLGERITPVVR